MTPAFYLWRPDLTTDGQARLIAEIGLKDGRFHVLKSSDLSVQAIIDQLSEYDAIPLHEMSLDSDDLESSTMQIHEVSRAHPKYTQAFADLCARQARAIATLTPEAP